jgi:methylmalonyl-CoA/ethylmalonyl-CoA epimerase
MITALDHIAIAVPDLEAAVRRFLDDFGLHYDGNEIVEAAPDYDRFL